MLSVQRWGVYKSCGTGVHTPSEAVTAQTEPVRLPEKATRVLGPEVGSSWKAWRPPPPHAFSFLSCPALSSAQESG